jgi:mobilization protein NikA
MKEKKIKRNRLFSFVVNEAEYETIEKLFARSTCRSINDYARSVALQKPVVVKIRNESAENFLLAMIPLKNQLEEAATHFSRSIVKLQSLESIPEIKAWCAEPLNLPETLLTEIEALRQLMNQYYIQCTRSSI